MGVRAAPAPPPTPPTTAPKPPWDAPLTALFGFGAAALRTVEAAQAVLASRLQPPGQAGSRLEQLRAAGVRPPGLSSAALLRLAEAHERSCDMAAAAAAYEAAISGADKGWLASAAGVSAAVGLAKQHSDQGWQSWAHSRGLPCVPTSTPPPSRDLAAGLERTLFALALSEEALALAPRCARAHTAVAACCGRLALYSEDPRQRVRLANRIRASAEAALALDAREDGAHHVLARWHLELSQLNPVLRALVRHVLRGDTDASAEAALAHYSAAAAIAPTRLVHRAELGKALLRLGRRREALVNLRAALSCEPEDVNAAMSRLHVQTIVSKMRRQERRMQREEQRAAAKARQEERRAAVRLERVARREARREAREARSSPARRGEADTAAATS